MAKTVRFLKDSQKEFQKVFQDLCYSRSSWQVWSDFIYMAAAALSNAVDQTGPLHDERERRYLSTIRQYSPKHQELFPRLFAIVVDALQRNPKQDCLGELFMGLELGNHWKGQFFTPYHICELMAEVTICGDGLEKEIERKGWVGINDCACGAGAMLIAARNVMLEHNISPFGALYVAQDLDETAALMCYIQLSLLGCSGYVVIANTLTHPVTGDVLDPIKTEDNDIWFMPMFYTEIWSMRRIWRRVDRLMAGAITEQEDAQGQQEPPSQGSQEPDPITPTPDAPSPFRTEETGQLTLF